MIAVYTRFNTDPTVAFQSGTTEIALYTLPIEDYTEETRKAIDESLDVSSMEAIKQFGAGGATGWGKSSFISTLCASGDHCLKFRSIRDAQRRRARRSHDCAAGCVRVPDGRPSQEMEGQLRTYPGHERARGGRSPRYRHEVCYCAWRGIVCTGRGDLPCAVSRG